VRFLEARILTDSPSGLPVARILIVDDDADIAFTIKHGLERLGYETETFTNPKEALNTFRQRSKAFCTVLSDIRMPHATGFDIAREVKSINSDVKVILMSSFEVNKEEYSNALPSKQIDDFLQKPAKIADVNSVLQKHIGQTKQLTGTDNNG
jgi:DNA-binding NtrC family response regulator